MDRADRPQNGHTEQKLTFASKEVKALSALRSDPQYLEQTRSADVGQALQLSLATKPPKLFPQHDAARLVDFFHAWVQEWELGMEGLAVLVPNSGNLGDVVPPWDFVWTDNYLCDPSVPPIDQIKPLDDINGFQMTDELCVNKGCDCDDDECDPRTCACLRRAADCYLFAESHYQKMFDPQNGIDGQDGKGLAPDFVYDEHGRIRMKDVPLSTPIFECNKFCSCSSSCRNRVVQKGKKAPLAFCKTESKGWGIKAVGHLAAGTFVGAYGGELLNDEESERRANVYDNKLGTTYLQTVDHHIIMVHLTRQILERELAKQNLLGQYRGSPKNDRKLVQLVTDTADAIDLYQDYFRLTGEEHDDDNDELGLLDAEMRIRDGTSDRFQEAHIFERAKQIATARAREGAIRKRARSEATNPSLAFGVDQGPITEEEFDDPVLKFLSLSPEQQDRACELQRIRSDLEDEHLVTVDSALWGNHTRFFNHSCDPNIYHVPVYTDNASIMRPLLAFFTNRDVKEGEELCFNYRGEGGFEDYDHVPQQPPQSPSKGTGRSRNKATAIHAPSTKPGAETVLAITATAADSAAAASKPTVVHRLDIRCRCGAKNCTGRVFA